MPTRVGAGMPYIILDSVRGYPGLLLILGVYKIGFWVRVRVGLGLWYLLEFYRTELRGGHLLLEHTELHGAYKITSKCAYLFIRRTRHARSVAQCLDSNVHILSDIELLGVLQLLSGHRGRHGRLPLMEFQGCASDQVQGERVHT